MGERNPIDLEVLGAPDFMAAKVPLVGLFFKSRAIQHLEAADRELALPSTFNNPLESCLIWSKLYDLTKSEIYRIKVKAAGLKRDMHEGQLRRISRHLGFGGDLGKLFAFCEI